jgi:anti-anti-sigma factor
MDCTGLGALIALSNLTRGRNCVLRLVNPTPPVRRLFDIVRLGTVFEIVVSQLPEASDLCQSTDA